MMSCASLEVFQKSSSRKTCGLLFATLANCCITYLANSTNSCINRAKSKSSQKKKIDIYPAVGGADAALLLGFHGFLESAEEGGLEGHGWLLAVEADSVQQFEGGVDLRGLSAGFVEGAQDQTAGCHHPGMCKSGK
jgi:hypothetical protein